MIVCIQEHYDGESSLVWFADTSKASKALHAAITKALADPDKSISVRHGKVGMQTANDYDTCHVKPPCMVDAAIELYCE
jgi:hypothetical protein